MGKAAKSAVDQLLEIGSGHSASLRELEETGHLFNQRLQKVLSNLPRGEIIEVPKDELLFITGPGASAQTHFSKDQDAESDPPEDFAARETSDAH